MIVRILLAFASVLAVLAGCSGGEVEAPAPEAAPAAEVVPTDAAAAAAPAEAPAAPAVTEGTVDPTAPAQQDAAQPTQDQ
jgi:hypothetical protein